MLVRKCLAASALMLGLSASPNKASGETPPEEAVAPEYRKDLRLPPKQNPFAFQVPDGAGDLPDRFVRRFSLCTPEELKLKCLDMPEAKNALNLALTDKIADKVTNNDAIQIPRADLLDALQRKKHKPRTLVIERNKGPIDLNDDARLVLTFIKRWKINFTYKIVSYGRKF